MKSITQIITDEVCAAIEEEGLGGILSDIEEVRFTKNAAHGDIQSNHAFDIGKKLQTNPRQVANRVAQRLQQRVDFARIEVAGPGFLNFFLHDDFLIQQAVAQVCDEHVGVLQSGKGKTMVIDYSSPNIAKRMHIGHMRSTIIGNAIDRIYRSAGWNVIADNHIGDWGTQFGKLIVAWDRDRDEEAFADDPIGELERLYVSFAQEATEEDMEKARQETVLLQQGDERNRGLWQQFIHESMKEFEKVYARLGISFDVVYGESFYNEALAPLVEELDLHEISSVSDGAKVIAFGEDLQPKMLNNTVLIVQKADGAFLYGTTDLATLDFRRAEFSPHRIIYVTDLRQQLHFQQVFSSWKGLQEKRNVAPENLPELIHIWFGMLKLDEGAMSSRKGNVIRLVDLIDEAVRRAQEVTDEKSSDFSSEERAQIAEAIGVSAIRYADLSQNPQTDVRFSWEKMLALEGNTAPFLMYSFARAKGILRKAGMDTVCDVSKLSCGTAYERALIFFLLRFPTAVEQALEQCKPNTLCDYLFELCSVFNRFYVECPVLSLEDEVLRMSRLALVEASLRVFQKCFSLLGIQALDRM